ncbi:MAG TPA: hypothetical protein VG206_13325, partial [Terriglobia bacterium]|nr:hypothetical protein [Terriglobia bacterium]
KSLARIRYKPADEAERVMLILAGDDWHELSNMGADAVPLLERILVSSPSREMRRSAAVALQRLLWTPADESQKIAFFLALGEFDHLVALGDSAVNQMIAVMSDKNYGERRRVPAALAEMELGSESKLQVFNALVSCLNTTEEMAVAATTTLGDMGCPDAVLPLIAQLDQWKGRAWTDEATVHALCVALGKLGDARAADLLKAFANDKLQYQSVQKAAQAALVNVLGPQAAEPELKIPPPIQAPVAIESTTSVTPRAEPIFEKKWWRFWR